MTDLDQIIALLEQARKANGTIIKCDYRIESGSFSELPDNDPSLPSRAADSGERDLFLTLHVKWDAFHPNLQQSTPRIQ